MITILIGLAWILGIIIGFIIATTFLGFIYIIFTNTFSLTYITYNVDNIWEYGGRMWGILAISAAVLAIAYFVGIIAT